MCVWLILCDTTSVEDWGTHLSLEFKMFRPKWEIIAHQRMSVYTKPERPNNEKAARSGNRSLEQWHQLKENISHFYLPLYRHLQLRLLAYSYTEWLDIRNSSSSYTSVWVIYLKILMCDSVQNPSTCGFAHYEQQASELWSYDRINHAFAQRAWTRHQI